MTERPILFNGAMVRAILDGSKTQTRRVVKLTDSGRVKETGSPRNWHLGDPNASLACPCGQPGEGLWVKETFQRFTDDGEIIYKADPTGFSAMNDLKRDGCLEARWRPSIHMPRWASRITLEITGVKVERLQDISEADALAEGVIRYSALEQIQAGCDRWGRHAYSRLWESVYGPGSWDANPWVWAVEFRRIKP